MARPREFDEEEALTGAVHQFWRAGYAATSISDLEVSTGLGRKSLYNAFGNKHSIFLQSLDLFTSLAGERFLGPMEAAGAGLAEIEGTLRNMVAEAETETGAFGCLICNTAREPVAEDPDVNARVLGYFGRIERAFANAIGPAIQTRALAPESGQPEVANSELATFELATSELATSELATSELATSELATSELATSELAQWMTGVLVSLCVLARSPAPQPLLESFLEQSLVHLRRQVGAPVEESARS